jgi:hypothetical protein
MFNLEIPTSNVHLQPEPLVAHPPRQLLTPLPTPGHFLLVIDNSSLEVFTTCPQSAYYKLVLKREAHARNAALTFGGALHEGLEEFLLAQASDQISNAQYNEQTPAVLEARKNREDQRILRFFTENPAPLDEYRTVQNCLAVLAAYRQRASMPDYQWEIQSDAHGPIIERAFELPLGVVEVNAAIEMPWMTEEAIDLSEVVSGIQFDRGGIPSAFVSHIHIAWSGRIDALAKANGQLRIVDHKTTSIYDNKFVDDFVIGNQILGYVWAGRQLWPDLDLSAFCGNIIFFRDPKGRPVTERGPRGGEPPLQFHRIYHEYTLSRLKQWETNCLNIVSDFIHCLVRDAFPSHTKWCMGKYGKCQYHDVCVQDDPRVRENMIKSDMFKTVTWNPVAGR